jgi:hypothetical protein
MITNLTNGNSFNSGNSSFSTASITPVAGRMYLIAVESYLNSGAVNTPTVSGCGLTWTQVATQLCSNNLRITFFRALGNGGTPGALTIDHGGQVQIACSWSIEECTGVKTTGTNGSDAIVQSAGGSISTPGSNNGITVLLNPLASSLNIAYGAVLNQQGQVVNTAPGYTQLTNIGSGIQTFATEFEVNIPSVEWTWTSGTGLVVALAIELATNLAGGNFVPFL